jgi:hypothetical protein
MKNLIVWIVQNIALQMLKVSGPESLSESTALTIAGRFFGRDFS